MDDFGFGDDPDARFNHARNRAPVLQARNHAQLDDDCDVLQDIERDLGKSYLAERVTLAKQTYDPYRGQRCTNGGPADVTTRDDIDPMTNMEESPIIFNEDDEKNIECLDYDTASVTATDNQPLQRTRKRKRTSIEHKSEDAEFETLDLTQVPNAKRFRASSHAIPSRALAIATTTDIDIGTEPVVSAAPLRDETEMYLYGRPSMNDTSLAITNDADGEKLYIYYDSELQFDRALRNCNKQLKHRTLGTDDDTRIDRLLDEIENERISNRIRDLNSEFSVGVEDEPVVDNDADGDDDDEAESRLWVDKYAPRRFIDLLSFEKINREVIEWVKQWDFVVFGHRYSRMHHLNNNKFVSNKNNANSSSNGDSSSRLKNGGKHVYSIRNNLPMFGGAHKQQPLASSAANHAMHAHKTDRKRPSPSVLLFTGPPGTGKSTLAHIVANHCGYRPFEINASDDRTGKKLKDVIINVATMRSMFGDTRPPLIIMDEIDGAASSNGDSKSAVDVIINIVKNAERHANEKQSQPKNQKKKSAAAAQIVNRPIICICNNEYSRTLRPLREIAQIFRFKPIANNKLCKRLLEVCRSEYIHTNLRTLSHLASITNRDIRACLHTLQFFKQRGGSHKSQQHRISSRLSVEILSKIPIGKKDQTQNIFSVWNKILKSRKQVESSQQRWDEIVTAMYGMGSDQKVMEGVVENYLSLGYSDFVMQNTLQTARWIEDYHMLQRTIRSKQQFFLLAYIPFTMIGVHSHCATDTFQRLQFPVVSYKHRMKLKENESIVQRFLHCETDTNQQSNASSTVDVAKYASLMARSFGIKSCCLELVPLLPFVIFTAQRWNDADFRADGKEDSRDRRDTHSRNFEFASTKRTFVSIINTMIQCGLNYVHSPTSSYLQLTPPIDALSKYSFERNQKMAAFEPMTQYVKERVAHQIELAVMRRNEAGINKYGLGGQGGDQEAEGGDDYVQNMHTPFLTDKQGKKTMSRRNPKTSATPCGEGQFGTVQTRCSAESQSQTPANAKNFIAAHNKKLKAHKIEYPIQYKFVQGYTNAVKRKSYVRDWI